MKNLVKILIAAILVLSLTAFAHANEIQSSDGEFTINGIKDYGYDKDEDGLFDYLVVELNINAKNEGLYYLDAILFSKDTEHKISYFETEKGILLKNGDNNIKINFSGVEIFNSEKNGSYTISPLDIRIIKDFQVEREYKFYNAYNTSNYSYTQFQAPFIVLGDTIAKEEIDTNNDNLIDYLEVKNQVNAKRAGDYIIRSELVINENKIMYNAQKVALNEGLNTFTTRFNGVGIYNSGADGNYSASLFAFYGDYGLIDSKDYLIGVYNNEQFQKPFISFTGKFSDYGYDYDNNGLFDFIYINAEVNSVREGTFYLNYMAKLPDGTTHSSRRREILLHRGLNNVTINISGIRIYDEGIDGKFSIDSMKITDNGDVVIAQLQESYSTQDYNHNQFEKPYGNITGISSSAIDQDNDGKFNAIAAEVEVNISKQGNYRITADLNDKFGREIHKSFAESYFTQGKHKLKVIFDGKNILANAQDGPFEINGIKLMHTDLGITIDSFNETYQTQAYKYTDFEKYLTKLTSINATTFDGQTTDFSKIPELSKAVNIVLEKAANGKIEFGSSILNLSGALDLDKYAIIANNIIGIDTAKLPQLNKPAKITMRGLNYQSSPIIYYTEAFGAVNGRLCTSDICKNAVFNQQTGVLTFEATHFSTFWTVSNSTSKLSIKSIDVKIDSKTEKLSDGESINKKAKPGSEIIFLIKLENLYNKTERINIKEISTKVLISDIDDGTDLEETANDFDISYNDDKEIEIKMKVPLNVDEGDFDVHITADGEDEKGAEHKTEAKLRLTVDKEKHNVIINKFTLSPDAVGCSKNVAFTVEMINIGSTNENDISFRITNNDLDINLAEKAISIDEGTEDNIYKRTMNIELSPDTPEGIYPIDFEAEYENGKNIGTERRELIAQKCTRTTTTNSDANVKLSSRMQKSSDAVEVIFASEQKKTPVTNVSVGNDKTYFIMLMLLNFVFVAAVILFTAVYFNKKFK